MTCIPKFYESCFDEYVTKSAKQNLHPFMDKIIKKFPLEIENFKNLIIYGPAGSGKYTQMLKCISRYSPSGLKYEKKISVVFNKQQYFFTISDIHYEVDISLMGCNSKMLWNEFFKYISDIINGSPSRRGIIVCKNFHTIHNEMLETFYSYMQHHKGKHDIKFILLTKEYSFIPEHIRACCCLIRIPRPTTQQYKKCVVEPEQQISKQFITNNTNIKYSHCFNERLAHAHVLICNKIIEMVSSTQNVQFIKLREFIYDIFIYNLDIGECVMYILLCLMRDHRFHSMSRVLGETFMFFKYYNNNYRQIYHFEKYLLILATEVK